MNKKIPLDEYKHISFDLDGTLVHTTEEYRLKIVPKVVKKLGGKIKKAQSINRFWFETARDIIIKEEFGLEPKMFWELFRELDLADLRSAYTHAYSDSEKTIISLKRKNKTISIITGSPQWIAQMEIEKLNGAPYDFFLPIGETEFEEKPNPRSMHYTLEKLGSHPGETLYIGNSNDDAYFAKNAGVDFVYLCRKEHDFDLDDYSIAKIHSLDELIL